MVGFNIFPWARELGCRPPNSPNPGGAQCTTAVRVLALQDVPVDTCIACACFLHGRDALLRADVPIRPGRHGPNAPVRYSRPPPAGGEDTPPCIRVKRICVPAPGSNFSGDIVGQRPLGARVAETPSRQAAVWRVRRRGGCQAARPRATQPSCQPWRRRSATDGKSSVGTAVFSPYC